MYEIKKAVSHVITDFFNHHFFVYTSAQNPALNPDFERFLPTGNANILNNFEQKSGRANDVCGMNVAELAQLQKITRRPWFEKTKKSYRIPIMQETFTTVLVFTG